MSGGFIGRADAQPDVADLGARPQGPRKSGLRSPKRAIPRRLTGGALMALMLIAALVLPALQRISLAQGGALPTVPAESLPAVACTGADAATPLPPDTSDGTDILAASPTATIDPAAATPEASPVAVDQADPETNSAVTRTIQTLAACLSEGNILATLELTSERYRGILTGTGTPLSRGEYSAIARQLPPVRVSIRAVNNVRLTEDGGVLADVLYVYGNQLLRGDWSLRPRAGESGARSWLIDDEQPLPIPTPEETEVFAVGMREYAITSRTRAEGPNLVLDVTNRGAEEHEILMLGLDQDADLTSLLRAPGPGLPEGMRFAGQITVPAGNSAELVLVDLEPGRYALVCLLPDAEGTPHLALGMSAEITVR